MNMKNKILIFLMVSAFTVLILYLFRNQVWGEPESQIVKTQVNNIENENQSYSFKNLIGSKWVNQKDNSKSAELGFIIDGDIKETKGFFEKFDIVFKVAEGNAKEAKMKVSIDVSSINTENTIRDKALMESDFFNQETYPFITYHSKKIQIKKDQITTDGSLELMGMNSDFSFNFEHKGVLENDQGIDVAIFEGEFTFDRTKFGMEHVTSVGDSVKMYFYCELVEAK